MTFPARPAKPRNPDALVGLEAGHALTQRGDSSDDLLPRHQRELRVGRFAVDHMEIRPAYRALTHFHKHLANVRCWRRQVSQPQRLPRLLQEPSRAWMRRTDVVSVGA